MNKYEVSSVLRDYHWMIRDIARIRTEMNQTESSGVAQYGIEAAMPKAQGGENSDPVAKEVVRREKKSKFQVKLEKKVTYIQDRIDLITDERQQAVLHCVLDGMSIRKTASHMGLTHTHITRIIDEIAKNMTDVPNVPYVQKMQQHIDMA